MRYIVTLAFLLTCSSPQPLMQSGNPDVRKVSNHIKIKGDSNTVNFHYYRIYGASQSKIDSLQNKLRKISTDSI